MLRCVPKFTSGNYKIRGSETLWIKVHFIKIYVFYVSLRRIGTFFSDLLSQSPSLCLFVWCCSVKACSKFKSSAALSDFRVSLKLLCFRSKFSYCPLSNNLVKYYTLSAQNVKTEYLSYVTDRIFKNRFLAADIKAIL